MAALPALAKYSIEKVLPPLRQLYLDRNQYLAFGKEQVMARAQDQKNGLVDPARKDIFSFLLSAKDPETGEGFPIVEMCMEGSTLIVAGSDTSST
jgi:cytochrome P450